MTDENLVVRISTEDYDAQIIIKSPDLVERYKGDMKLARDYIHSALQLALGDLSLPEHLRHSVNQLRMEHLQGICEIVQNDTLR